MIRVDVKIVKGISRKEEKKLESLSQKVDAVRAQITQEVSLNPEPWSNMSEEWWELEMAWRVTQLEEIEKQAEEMRGGVIDRIKYRLARR